MRRFAFVVILAVALLAQGCLIVSIHPLYTENDVVFDEALLGTWGSDPSEGESWVFEQAEGKAYRMTVNEKGKEPGHFEAHLVKLGEYLFLDLYPEEPDGINEFFISHVIPAHSIWRATITADSLSLASLDYDWLTREIEAGQLDVEHEKLEHVLVLTGEPSDLQMLVLKHPHEAFDDEPDVAVRIK
ncbi:MAG: hypothetical protein KAW61_07470 [candidate division Zixibacteria bacterium]|nr:hypothetical protein [candidate division Zixibacteria bacterium]